MNKLCVYYHNMKFKNNKYIKFDNCFNINNNNICDIINWNKKIWIKNVKIYYLSMCKLWLFRYDNKLYYNILKLY